MTAVRFSVLIPVFNAEGFVGELLDSFPRPLPTAFELIVVDDGSTDRTAKILETHPLRPWIRVVRSLVNEGPAAARNRAAASSSGEFLLFFDSDVVLLPGTLTNVERYVEAHPGVRCASGVDAPESATPGWVPRFLALYSRFALELMPEDSVASAWNPRAGLLERALFQEVGGFDSRYRRADVEDYALSRKVSEITPIRFTRSIEVMHRFGGLVPTTASFFRRSRYWVELAWRTRRLDRTGHTRTSHLPAVLLSFAVGGCALASPWLPLRWPWTAMLALFLGVNGALLRFFVRHAGVMRGISFLGLLMYFHWLAGLGALVGALRVAAGLVVPAKDVREPRRALTSTVGLLP